jgi:nitroreductase/NAD-dependent dihydropyrimidine dehydrogenase PreA subunit
MGARPIIDHSKCTLCGLCVENCHLGKLAVDGKRVVSRGECILCGQCYAVCRPGAIRFDMLKKRAFSAFSYKEAHLPPGLKDVGRLVNMLASRRSVRKYRKEVPPDEVIADVIEASTCAPSGHNCQTWNFTVVRDREKIARVRDAAARLFAVFNAIAGNPVLRVLMYPFFGGAMTMYRKLLLEDTRLFVSELKKGKDLFLHDAPLLVVLHGGTEGATPADDAQYAAYNVCLVGHVMGVGTCFNGYAREAFNSVPGLSRALGIPRGHRVHAVLTMGYPASKFVRPAPRKEYKVNWV